MQRERMILFNPKKCRLGYGEDTGDRLQVLGGFMKYLANDIPGKHEKVGVTTVNGSDSYIGLECRTKVDPSSSHLVLWL